MASNTPTGAYYASVQEMQGILDFNESAYNTNQIKSALAQATDTTDAFLHRTFFPTIETRLTDWYPEGPATPWRLWLTGSEIISVSSMSSGGVNIPPANLKLEPNGSGPPFDRIEVSIATSSVLQSGSTWQQAISITGTWGYSDRADAVTTLGASVSTVGATTMQVTDSSKVGVGNLCLIDSEYVVITDRAFVTTSQTLLTPLAASVSDNSVSVTTGSAYGAGESILLDSEQMLVLAVVGNSLMVRRAYNGTALAAHTGSTIFAPRLQTITRGASGSTPATHSSAATVKLQWIPPAAKALCIAEAGWLYESQASGWQTSEGDSSRGQFSLKFLQDLRLQVQSIVGRSGRTRHV
jgi:hypothetical protein